MSSSLRRWLPLLGLGVVLVVALAVGVGSRPGHETVADRVQAITSQLRCPVCSGETVADSSAPISQDIRTVVQQRVEAGQSNGQITAFIVQKYPGTLLRPPTSGIGLIVWVLPVMAFLLAAGGLAMVFARWHARSGVVVSDDDRALVAEALRR
jgi:cytochrome c-type biogenesis protein CcmH